jgi:excisionase family DNA binding protein
VVSAAAAEAATAQGMTATQNGTQWLTVAEVCEHLKIARSTWNKWLAKGRAPRAKRLPNGGLRINMQDLTAWLDELPEAC